LKYILTKSGLFSKGIVGGRGEHPSGRRRLIFLIAAKISGYSLQSELKYKAGKLNLANLWIKL